MPLTASDINFYAVGLRNAQNGANADVNVYATVNAPTNDQTTILSVAQQLKAIGVAARQGTHTVSAQELVLKDSQGLDQGDLDANSIFTGRLAKK